MTTITEQTGAIIDYLVTQVAQATAGGVGGAPVVVFDGPTITGTQLVEAQRIWVGADGPSQPGQEVEAATFAEDFAFLDHAATRDDRVDISMAAEFYTGNPTQIRTARDGVFALMAVVETLLRGDTTRGGPGDASMGGLVFWSQVAGPCQLIQAQATDGVSALVRFRVTAFTRLTS